MNCRALSVAALGTAAISISPSLADPLDVCVKLSQSGLVDTRDTSIARDQATRDFNLVCQRTEDRVSRARSRAQGGNVGYGAFSLGLSQASTSAEENTNINNICKEGEAADLAHFTFNESVTSGQHVVGLVNSCLTLLTQNKTESIFGYTIPSISSDESFNVQFRYTAGQDSRRPYKLVGLNVDQAAQVQCPDINSNVSLAPGPTNYAMAAITCSKAKGVSAAGIFVFKSADSDQLEKLVNFTVISPVGEEIIRSKLKAEYDAKLAALRDELAARLTKIEAKTNLITVDSRGFFIDVKFRDLWAHYRFPPNGNFQFSRNGKFCYSADNPQNQGRDPNCFQPAMPE